MAAPRPSYARAKSGSGYIPVDMPVTKGLIAGGVERLRNVGKRKGYGQDNRYHNLTVLQDALGGAGQIASAPIMGLLSPAIEAVADRYKAYRALPRRQQSVDADAADMAAQLSPGMSRGGGGQGLLAGGLNPMLDSVEAFGKRMLGGIDNTADDLGYPRDLFRELVGAGASVAAGPVAKGLMRGVEGAGEALEGAAGRLGYTLAPEEGLLASGVGPRRRRPSRGGDNTTGFDASAAPGKAVVRTLFPEYADRYPAVGKPVEEINEKGKPFLSKGWTPEMEEFERGRKVVMKDMDQNGYTPMFDPKARYDANPDLYGPRDLTVEQIMKKPDTQAKYDAMANSSAAKGRWNEAYDAGMKFADDAGNWYYMGQLQDAFIKELGPIEGPKKFKERFADAMAATTGGADPDANLLMSAYGNYLKETGAKWPEGAYEMPYPIGGRYASGNMDQYRKMLMGGGAGVTAENPKRYNFSGDFLGHKTATVDEQGMGLFDPKMTVPPPGSYGHFEGGVNNMAAERGVDPRWFQEVGWAGKKFISTKGKFKPRPMITYVNDMIERTARLTGQSPEEVLRRYIRANGPMYSVAGGVGLGGGLLATQGQQEQDPYAGLLRGY